MAITSGHRRFPGMALGLVVVLGMVLAGLPAAAAERKALLIGINDYLANDPGQEATGAWVPQDLNGALNDIRLMRAVLENRFGFAPEQVRTLENQAATRAAILEQLQRFVGGTEPGDVVYIHFSGHGSQVEDRDGDEADGLDESILPYDARTAGVPDITDDELGAILAGLATDRAWVVLDSCHSGTATRGSMQLLTRSVQVDPRGELYPASLPPTSVAGALAAPYVLMTGAADYQSALDGPIDEGRHYGLFSLSMGRVLAQATSELSAREVHARVREEMQRIGSQFGLYAIPEAQLEGPEPRLEAALVDAAADVAAAPVQPLGDGRVRLEGAGRLAAEAGSLWAMLPPGEQRPGPDTPTLTVESVGGDDATAVFEGRGEAPVAGSRAVPLAPAAADASVSVRLEGIDEAGRAALQAGLPAGSPVRFVGPGEFARYVVEQAGERLRVSSAGALQAVAEYPGADPALAAAGLDRLARRSVRLAELLALSNPASRLQVSVRVNPVDASGAAQGLAVGGAGRLDAFRVRAPGEPRDPGNSLVLEIEVSAESYLTVVNVDAAGELAVLFPNPVSERNGFYPDGRVPGGRPVRLPDGLGPNRAGFHWDLVPPAGLDTVRVFAARELATAQALRQHIASLGGPATVRGAAPPASRRALYMPARASAMTTRGIATVASAAQPAAPDWSAATVTFKVQE